MKRWMVAAVALVLFGAACRGSESPTISGPSPSPTPAAEVTVSISSPADGTEVGGNVVAVDIAAAGVQIKAPDGDTSGTTGHYHVFVDREPTPEGQVVPMEPGIVHAAVAPVTLTGLSPGEHTIIAALGNGVHERIGPPSAPVKVNVKGPSVKASAPATVKAGEPVVVTLSAQGFQVKAADGDKSGRTGHYHLFIDPEKAPTADGTVIPKTDKIIHATESSYSITGLAPGPHTVWVVAGDGLHIPLDPLVADKLTVTVQ
ncbi:MAG: DUF4399 domain-containing protein [Actinomycetota bacterium]